MTYVFVWQFPSRLLREIQNMDVSAELMGKTGHRKEILKLTFRALALCESELHDFRS